MRRWATICLSILAAGTISCVTTWKSAGGALAMHPDLFSPAGSMEDAAGTSSSGVLTFTLPAGWHWYLRGRDLIATRDGVFLQQILVERLHVEQVEQKSGGTGAWSASAWPVRTARNLQQRFVADMPPADAAEVLLGSRAHDPGVTDLTVRKIVTRTIAGRQAFRALFDFRVKSTVVDPSPLYRSVTCGFVLGDWFYGIGYTAAARSYFERDLGAFETFLESVRLDDGAAGRVQGAAPQLSPLEGTQGLLPPMILKADEGDRPGEGEAPGIEEDPVAAAALGEAFLAVLKAGSGEPTAIRQEEIGPVDFPRPVAVAGRLPGGGAKPFQEAALSVAYPPGSLAAIMERHRLVGVWVVSGIVTEATAQGRGLLLRAALVDRNGTVRFSDLVAESAPADLRDPGGAQRVARALLAEYPTIAENRRAGQDVGHAMEAPHAMEARADTPRFLHPADFRLGLGVFFVAGTDLWAGFLPRNSRWQFGYRYVLWNDTFEDPYTGRELTETTESLQGPQVNFLFRPEKRGTWYLGTSALQWSKSETAKANGVTDSASVTSLFLGGGYTHRLGKHVYWSGAMFLAPWADLSTDTGASSDESSGGFDVQIQIGGAF